MRSLPPCLLAHHRYSIGHTTCTTTQELARLAPARSLECAAKELTLPQFSTLVVIRDRGEMTIKEFGEAVLKATGSSSKFTFKPLPEDDPKVRKPDISKAQRVLEWEPVVDLEDGLARTTKYFKKKIGVSS